MGAPIFGRDPARKGNLGPREPDRTRGHLPIGWRGSVSAGDGNVVRNHRRAMGPADIYTPVAIGTYPARLEGITMPIQAGCGRRLMSADRIRPSSRRSVSATAGPSAPMLRLGPRDPSFGSAWQHAVGIPRAFQHNARRHRQ